MIKASKTTKNMVSISIGDAITLIRNHLNQHGSREAGVHISIPSDANWDLESEHGGNIATYITFEWIEKV